MTAAHHALHTGYRGARFLSRVLLRDMSNVFAHGVRTPRMHEQIWVDPRQCETMNGEFDWSNFGELRCGDWDNRSLSLREEPATQEYLVHWNKIGACLAHWTDGISWESTGIYDHMLQLIEAGGRTDGCISIDDITRRYRKLDEIFEEVKRSKKLSTRAELSHVHFREVGGVLFHIDRNLKPVFGLWGCHRYAMAVAAELPLMPAQVGVVHAEVEDTWRDQYSRGARRGTFLTGRRLAADCGIS